MTRAKGGWWFVARNSPLAAGLVNLGIAIWMRLSIRPGDPHPGEALWVCKYFALGAVMSVPGRFAPWQGVRAASMAIGALPVCLLGLGVLLSGPDLGEHATMAMLLLLWVAATACVTLLGRAWANVPDPRACKKCGYDRSGLAEDAKCPECASR